MPRPESPTKSRSAFRTVALVISGMVTIWLVFTTIIVVRYGDRIRDFGWDADGVVVRSVESNGPAAGRLRPGDVIAAFNGDRRVARVGQENFRFFVPPGANYSLTILRGGVEQTVSLTTQTGPTSVEQRRLAYPSLVNALAVLVVFTLIAAYCPDLPLARVGYIGAMLIAVGQMALARGEELIAADRTSLGAYASSLWLPERGRLAIMFLFWFPPLHLALAYDFFSRFPPGISTTKPWRLIRGGLYALCGVISIEGPLLDRLLLLGGPEPTLQRVSHARPCRPLVHLVESVNRPFGTLALVAVLVRNYRPSTPPTLGGGFNGLCWRRPSGRHRSLTQLRRLVGALTGAPMGVDVVDSMRHSRSSRFRSPSATPSSRTACSTSRLSFVER